MLISLAVFAANLRACFCGVGSILPLISAELGLTNTVGGVLTTLPVLVFAMFSFLAPILARRFGLGQTLLAAFSFIFIGIAVRSYTGSAGLFIGTVLMSIGIGFGNVLTISMIKLRFSHRVGFVTGMYSVSMAFSAAVSVGISVPVATGLGLGWRNALGMWLLLAVLSLVLWIIRIKKEPDLKGKEKPGTKGSRDAHIAYRVPMAWCLAAFISMQTLLFYGMTAWLPTILQSRGYSLEHAAALALYMQSLSLPSTLVVPILCARRQDQRVLILIFGGALFAGLLTFFFARDTASTLIALAMFSVGIGASLGFSHTFFSLRTDNAQQSAALSGMCNTVGYSCGAVGPFLLGLIFDMTGSWSFPLLLMLTVAFIYVFFGLSLARDRSFFREYFEKKNEAARLTSAS